MKTFSKLLGLAVICLSLTALTALPAVARANGTPRSQADEIRHQILMNSYYGVFDWIDAETRPDNTVVLHGQVRNPLAKPEAENRIRKVQGVAKVVNEIEVLPISQSDDDIRIATYRAIFRYNSPLSRYANPVVPSIHIIVDNGRVTLKGIVGDSGDRQLAYFAARYVPGVFALNNELTIDNPKS